MNQDEQSNFRPYNGGCHCGAIRYRVLLDPSDLKALRCNCSICHKKGGLTISISDSTLTLVKPTSFDSPELADYTFHEGSTAHHHFCKNCGISMFAQGSYMFEGQEVQFQSINALTIDQAVGDAEGGKLDLSNVKISYWNGLLDDWKSGSKDEPYPGGCV